MNDALGVPRGPGGVGEEGQVVVARRGGNERFLSLVDQPREIELVAEKQMP